MIQDFYILSSVRKSPKRLVVLSHGYGADGRDLLFAGQYWKKILRDTLFVVPSAPEPVAGLDGRQWFDMGDRGQSFLEKGSEHAASLLRDFVVNIQKSYGVSWHQTILSGFSQGGMVSLAAGLLYDRLCRGVVSYSAGLCVPKERLPVLSHPVDICLVHGADDAVVPCAASKATKELLAQRNHAVSLFVVPHLAHQINRDGLAEGALFIQSVQNSSHPL